MYVKFFIIDTHTHTHIHTILPHIDCVVRVAAALNHEPDSFFTDVSAGFAENFKVRNIYQRMLIYVSSFALAMTGSMIIHLFMRRMSVRLALN